MKDIKDLFKRYYTKELENNKDLTVYDLFDWTKRDVLLKDYKTGRIIVEMKDLDFPSHYTQNAVDIIASKYFRKAGVNNEFGYENSMKMVVHRMVNFWMESLADEGIIKTQEEKDIFYDEMVYGLLNQMYAPNSPQWFNTGLKLSYGIEGGQNDLFFYDDKLKQVVKSPDTYTRTQASACFILSVEDKLLGDHSISEQYVTETKLFKGGSGTGTNFSNIRAIGEHLTGGGVSSGLMSFLKGLDRNAGAIKSGGTTRRAAKMVCLDIDHPEIEQFILWKAKEEDKVRALSKMGYDADIDGEAYETVSGQNSNNSLRISDEFMSKVKNLENDPDQTITLKGRVDESVNRDVKVSKLWEEFNSAACKSADPAPQFTDTFNAWHTCPAGEDGDVWAKHNRLNSTNPCGEYAFLDDTSCNLSSINIYRFYDPETNTIDIDGLKHMINLNQLLLESSIHWGQFPTVDIARKTYMFRTTGLGIANVASLLMARAIPYDSDEARTLSAALIGLITGQSYAVSALMAKAVGAFEKYDINKKYMNRVIRNHARVAGALDTELEELHYDPIMVNHGLLLENELSDLSKALKESWLDAVNLGEKFGYRNAQVSVIAPTGTISFAMDCAATSIEPFFSHVVYKKLVGGGFMTIANPIIEVALKNLGYKKEEIKEIMAYIGKEKNGMIVDGKIEGAPYLKEEHLPIFDTANVCGTGSRYIQHYGHVYMVAALTPLVSGAISKTVNLPKDATVEDFKEVHIRSWETGVKGISLYRDGSKFAQPLNTRIDKEDENPDLDNLTYPALLEYTKSLIAESPKTQGAFRREKMSGIRAGHTHPAQIDDVKVYITVNRNVRGEISEIYMTTDREGTLITGLLNSLSKTISVMLQYHIPPKDISKMLRGQKYEPYGFVSKHPYIKNVSSISDLISKVIDIELGDYSRVQIKPEEDDVISRSKSKFTNAAFEPEKVKQLHMVVDDSDVKDVIKDAEKNGEKLYDSVCSTCSSTRMVRNGVCKVCLDCGSTTGCS